MKFHVERRRVFGLGLPVSLPIVPRGTLSARRHSLFRGSRGMSFTF
jgi:hypothetical protein